MLPSAIPQRDLEAEVALHVVKELERQKEEGALLRLPLVQETHKPPYRAILCNVDTLTTAITTPMRQPQTELRKTIQQLLHRTLKPLRVVTEDAIYAAHDDLELQAGWWQSETRLADENRGDYLQYIYKFARYFSRHYVTDLVAMDNHSGTSATYLNQADRDALKPVLQSIGRFDTRKQNNP